MGMDMDKDKDRFKRGQLSAPALPPGAQKTIRKMKMKEMKEGWNDKEVGEGLDGLEEDDKEWKEKRKREEKKKKRERERE